MIFEFLDIFAGQLARGKLRHDRLAAAAEEAQNLIWQTCRVTVARYCRLKDLALLIFRGRRINFSCRHECAFSIPPPVPMLT